MLDRLMPTVFVSHGAPTIVLPDSPIRPFFKGLGETLGRPRGIICVSAHWETSRPAVSTVAKPETVHDFKGFPADLYELTYPAPGAPGLAAHVSELLDASGLDCAVNKTRGLDSGAWVPLSMMYPDANIPVMQLSVQPELGAAHHVALGNAIQELRQQGNLILASGTAVHNRDYFSPGGQDVPDWAKSFEDWVVEKALAADVQALTDYRIIHPAADLAHPTEEHFLPLLVALGAGSDANQGHLLHRGFMDGALSMAAFAFD